MFWYDIQHFLILQPPSPILFLDLNISASYHQYRIAARNQSGVRALKYDSDMVGRQRLECLLRKGVEKKCHQQAQRIYHHNSHFLKCEQV
jgi:hypothetical protein